MTDCRWQIQIKQRGGKWVMWCNCETEAVARIKWKDIDQLRRKARLVDNKIVIARYDPPVIKGK